MQVFQLKFTSCRCLPSNMLVMRCANADSLHAYFSKPRFYTRHYPLTEIRGKMVCSHPPQLLDCFSTNLLATSCVFENPL